MTALIFAGSILLCVLAMVLIWINEQYRKACAYMYQYAGATNSRVEVLDNLSALAHGERAPHDWNDLYPAGPEGITWNLYADAIDWDYHVPGGDVEGIRLFLNTEDLVEEKSCAMKECGAVRVSVTEIERISVEDLRVSHGAEA